MTHRRIRAYAAVMAVSLWSIWLLDISRPGAIDRLGKVKGTDFIHFYVIGSIAREGAWSELYDARAQQARSAAIVANPPVYLPVESPQSALVMAPFARLPYTAAFLAWTALILAVYAACCGVLLRETGFLDSHRRDALLACAAFPGVFSLVLHGQTSFVALACIAANLVAFARNRPFAAGLAIGCLVFKPHWLLAGGAVLLFAGEWRALAGAALSAIAQTAITGAVVGTSVMRAYATTLRTLPQISELLEPRPGDSLKGFFQVVSPSESLALGLYVATAIAVLLIAAQLWRRAPAFEPRASALVLATILVSPHVNTYDLVLLGPAVLMMTAWLAQHAEDSRITACRWLLVALFMAPLLNGLPSIVRLQFSVTAMVALLALIGSIAGVAPAKGPEILHGIVAGPAEWPTTDSRSICESASAVTPAPSLASPSTRFR